MFFKRFWLDLMLISIKKLLVAAVTKAGSALAGFGLVALVARNLDESQAGLFLLGMTIVTAMSMFSRLGLDNIILKYIAGDNANDASQKKLNAGLLSIFCSSLMVTGSLMYFSEYLSLQFFGKQEFSSVLFWMSPSISFIALFFIIGMAFQAKQQLLRSAMFQNLGLSGLFFLVCSVVVYFEWLHLTAVLLAKIYTLLSAFILILAIGLWFYVHKHSFFALLLLDKRMVVASANLWLATIMALCVQWSGVIVGATFMSASDVALLSAAQRTVMFVVFFQMIINVVVVPRYAKYWKEGEIEKLTAESKRAARVMLLASLPLVSVLLMLPEYILSIFGSAYSEAVSILLILLFGQFVTILCGSSGYILNMTGFDRDFRNMSVLSGIAAIVLSFILTREFGMVGAAASMSIAISVQNIGLLLFVKKRLGFWGSV